MFVYKCYIIQTHVVIQVYYSEKLSLSAKKRKLTMPVYSDGMHTGGDGMEYCNRC